MTLEELVAFARKTAYLLTREVFETTELLSKTRDGTYDIVPPLLSTAITPTVDEALQFHLPTEHGCKSGHQILKRKIFKKLVRARIFGPQRSRLLKELTPLLEAVFKTPTDQLLFTSQYRGTPNDSHIIARFNQLLKDALHNEEGVILLLADGESGEIVIKTRIKSFKQCSPLYFDYLCPLMLLLTQRETLIIDINDLQYQTCEEQGIVERVRYTELAEIKFNETNMAISVDINDYITRRLVTSPRNPREAIEQAAITCTRRIIKTFGCVREVHFTEKMFEEEDSIGTLLQDPIPDGNNQIIQLRAKILRDFPGSNDFVQAVEQLTLAEFASMFIGLHVWRENRGRIL